MYSCHKNFEKCKFPAIRDLFFGAKYFDSSTFHCKCIIRSSIYSREWDYEYLEHFSHFAGGINHASSLLRRILELKGQFPLDKELIQKISSIPHENKAVLFEILEKLGNPDLERSINRILIYHNKDKKNFNEGFLGFIDITPLGDICDAFIVPPHWMKPPLYYITCARKFIPETTLRYSENDADVIICTPYVSISGMRGDIGVCAQYAVRMALMILSTKAPTVPELIFEASRTTLKGGIERQQSGGWDGEEIKQIIEGNRYGAFRYSKFFCKHCNNPMTKIRCENCGKNIEDSPFLIEPSIENIYAYVESGIPVIIGVKNTKYLPWWSKGDTAHALVAIGHTISPNGEIDGLIVHDESRYPYQVLKEPLIDSKKLSDIISEAIVPVPREVVVDYSIACSQAMDAIKTIFNLDSGDVFRPLLTDANQIKKWLGEGVKREHLHSYRIPKKVRNDFLAANMDRYVWLFEIGRDNKKNKRKYLGDVIISAIKPELLAFINPSEKIYAFKDSNLKPIVKKY